MRTPTLLVALCAALFGLSACATSRGTTDEPVDLPTPREEVTWASIEDFDPEPYRVAAPEPTTVEHDVPEALMENRADRDVVRSVQGYRIQVFSTLDKNEALEREIAAKDWWAGVENPPASIGATLPVYVLYRQPYYRVRLGNFGSRAAAERALAFVQQRFPEAFLTPDTVTIQR